MSLENLEKFIDYLRQNKLYLVGPRALTSQEILTVGNSLGYQFDLNMLEARIEEIQKTQDSELDDYLRSWKKEE